MKLLLILILGFSFSAFASGPALNLEEPELAGLRSGSSTDANPKPCDKYLSGGTAFIPLNKALGIKQRDAEASKQSPPADGDSSTH